MSGIRLEAVRKEFAGGVVAVDDLSLEVEPGEFLVLVGPSGCGKSTTLRMVAGLEALTSGEVFIDGRNVSVLPPRRRDVAMVFQNYALYAHMTVRDNIGFGLKMAGLPKEEIRRRVANAAEVLELAALLDRKPKQLSGGQRQRVAMGRAIVREPAAFLMDEPLSNLDAKLRVEMRGEVVGVQRRIGAPTLYVTHDQTEAMTMGDRVAILRDGVLEQLGTPDEIYDSPANRFVAAFVGSPAMNLLDARLESDGTVAFDDCRLAVPEATFGTRKRLRDYVGTSVVVGIRPEDFGTGAGKQLVSGVVDRVELLGSEVVAYIQTGPTSLVTARLDRKERFTAGQRVEVGVDVSRLYFFDSQTGHAIA